MAGACWVRVAVACRIVRGSGGSRHSVSRCPSQEASSPRWGLALLLLSVWSVGSFVDQGLIGFLVLSSPSDSSPPPRVGSPQPSSPPHVMPPRLAFSPASLRRVGFACRTAVGRLEDSFSMRMSFLRVVGNILFHRWLHPRQGSEDQCHYREDGV